MLTIKPGQPVQWETTAIGDTRMIPKKIYHQGIIAVVTDNQKTPAEKSLVIFSTFYSNRLKSYILVKHDFSGQLELIDCDNLEDRPMRQPEETNAPS